MESSSEKSDQNVESGEPNDFVKKVHTEIIDDVIQSECHSVDELKNEINPKPCSSNNETNEDIDINDIVLITESVPVIESFTDNNKTIEPNITDKESESQTENQNESDTINIDNIELIQAAENEMPINISSEKYEDEPMDIDEILNSLDFDPPSNNEVQNVCEASAEIVAEKTTVFPSIEKRKDEEIVLLSDDDDETDGRFD